MSNHREDTSEHGRKAWVRWVGVVVALGLGTVTGAALVGEAPVVEAQTASERQRLVQYERRRTEAAEEQARAAKTQAKASERAARAAEKQARALEKMTRSLSDLERVCSSR